MHRTLYDPVWHWIHAVFSEMRNVLLYDNKLLYNCCLVMYKGALLDEWRKIHSTSSENSLSEKLSTFYDLLISAWHTQIQWCGKVRRLPVHININRHCYWWMCRLWFRTQFTHRHVCVCAFMLTGVSWTSAYCLWAADRNAVLARSVHTSVDCVTLAVGW